MWGIAVRGCDIRLQLSKLQELERVWERKGGGLGLTSVQRPQHLLQHVVDVGVELLCVLLHILHIIIQTPGFGL